MPFEFFISILRGGDFMKHNLIKKISYGFALTLALTFSVPVFAGTGVFVNGRELSRLQVLEVARVTGNIPARGSYLYNPATGQWLHLNSGASGRIGQYGSSRNSWAGGTVVRDGDFSGAIFNDGTSVTCGP